MTAPRATHKSTPPLTRFLLSCAVATWSTWLSLLLLTDVGIHVHLLEYSGLAEKAFNRLGLQITDVGCVRDVCVCVCVCVCVVCVEKSCNMWKKY